MMKWFITIFLILCMVGLVNASMCEDVVSPQENCTMITPYMSCSNYNYTILNLSGSIVEVGNLTYLNNQIYYLNFSQPVGGYVVTLCDQSTREIYVRGDNMGFSIAIIFSLAVLIGTLFFITNHAGEEHEGLRFLFYTIALFLGVGAITIAKILSEQMALNSLAIILEKLYILGVTTIYLYFAYIFVYVIYKVLQFKGVIPRK